MASAIVSTSRVGDNWLVLSLETSKLALIVQETFYNVDTYIYIHLFIYYLYLHLNILQQISIDSTKFI